MNPGPRPIIIVLLTLVAIAAGIVIARLSGVGVEDAAAPPVETTAAVIEYVHDGDTLFLEDGRKVRLLGIDTPEIGENLECYGDEAADLLRTLLPEGSAVEVAEDVEPLDQYGRSLLYVYTADGLNVNLEMIRRGAAEAVVLEPNVLMVAEAEEAEAEAKAAGAGRWGQC